MKKILALLLIICICFCAVGCNKVTDTNSSDLSSTITETKNESVCVDEQKDSANNNTTEESFPNTLPNDTTTSYSSATNSIENSQYTQTTGSEHYHIYSDATCTHPRTCSCGATIGSVREHNWEKATCQKPKTCYNCGKIEGEKIEHYFNDSICMWCGIEEYTFETTYLEMVDASPILIIGIMPYRYADYRLIITKQNELYKFSEDKKFSNGSHFKKIESDEKFLKFIRFADTIIIVTVDNKVFIYSDSSDRLLSPNETKDTDFSNFVSYSNKYNIGEYKTIFDMENTTGTANFKTENNNILSVDGELLYTFPKGENILLALDGGIIKTTKGFYTASYREWYEQEFADSDKKLKKEVEVYKKSGYSTINQFFEIL